MKATEWKPPYEGHRTEATERNLRSGTCGAEAAEWNLRNGSHEMDATERKQPDTSSQTQATMQLYDTVALWHDGRSYSSRIMIPSIGGTVTLICF